MRGNLGSVTIEKWARMRRIHGGDSSEISAKILLKCFDDCVPFKLELILFIRRSFSSLLPRIASSEVDSRCIFQSICN